MAATAEAEFDNDVWDQETMIELRRFALEQAIVAHMHKREAPVDLAKLFQEADRMVNYIVGDLTP